MKGWGRDRVGRKRIEERVKYRGSEQERVGEGDENMGRAKVRETEDERKIGGRKERSE